MYSHLSQAVAQEQTVDKYELAAADRLAAQATRRGIDADELGRAAAPSRRPVRVPLQGHVARTRESGCASA